MWIGARHLRYEHEENTMSKSMAELDGRRADGLEVALLWDRTDGGLTVRVADMSTGASFELPVSPGEARIAFDHPYAYAAARGVGF
jgi:hypothetical protein